MLWGWEERVEDHLPMWGGASDAGSWQMSAGKHEGYWQVRWWWQVENSEDGSTKAGEGLAQVEEFEPLCLSSSVCP